MPASARICLVTGATRGAGLAIAVELGRGGATVYLSGRSTRADGATEGLPGTVEDAAAAVDAVGGRGIGVRCDHARDDDVAALVARIGDEHGRLDVLVNNVWGGYEDYGAAPFTAPLWEQPVARRWDAMFERGVRAHLVTSALALPLLLRPAAGQPRVVCSTVAWAGGSYLGSVVYDVAKASLVRLAFALGEELRPHGVAAVAIAPGFMRTERVLAVHAAAPFDLSATESPTYLGRAVAALAADPDVLRHSGRLLTAGELAPLYGFTDVDGTQPPPFAIPG